MITDEHADKLYAEIFQKDAEIARLRAENERLREALLAWEDAVKIDVTMEGPRFMGIEHIRGKKAWGLTAAILEGANDE